MWSQFIWRRSKVTKKWRCCLSPQGQKVDRWGTVPRTGSSLQLISPSPAVHLVQERGLCVGMGAVPVNLLGPLVVFWNHRVRALERHTWVLQPAGSSLGSWKGVLRTALPHCPPPSGTPTSCAARWQWTWRDKRSTRLLSCEGSPQAQKVIQAKYVCHSEFWAGNMKAEVSLFKHALSSEDSQRLGQKYLETQYIQEKSKHENSHPQLALGMPKSFTSCKRHKVRLTKFGHIWTFSPLPSLLFPNKTGNFS